MNAKTAGAKTARAMTGPTTRRSGGRQRLGGVVGHFQRLRMRSQQIGGA